MIDQRSGSIFSRHRSKRSAQNPFVQRTSSRPTGRTWANGLEELSASGEAAKRRLALAASISSAKIRRPKGKGRRTIIVFPYGRRPVSPARRSEAQRRERRNCLCRAGRAFADRGRSGRGGGRG